MKTTRILLAAALLAAAAACSGDVTAPESARADGASTQGAPTATTTALPAGTETPPAEGDGGLLGSGGGR